MKKKLRGQEHHWTWIRSSLVYQVIRIYCRDINGGEAFGLVSYSYYTKLSESWNFEHITPLRVLHLKFPYIFLWLSLSMSTMIMFMWRNLLRLGEISQKETSWVPISMACSKDQRDASDDIFWERLASSTARDRGI